MHMVSLHLVNLVTMHLTQALKGLGDGSLNNCNVMFRNEVFEWVFGREEFERHVFWNTICDTPA